MLALWSLRRDALTALEIDPHQQCLLLRLLAVVLHLGNAEFVDCRDATRLKGTRSEAALREASRLLAFKNSAQEEGQDLLFQSLTSRAIRDVRKALNAAQAKAARDAVAKVCRSDF